MTQRLEAKGCKTTASQSNWDDGSDHDDVTKIYVRGGREGIQFIKFDYVKTGQLIDGSFHGDSNIGFTQMFEIDHLKNEYLLSVEGYYNPSETVVCGLQFKTNLKISQFMGYELHGDNKFTLAMDGKKIIGFHGISYDTFRALGAYVTSITPTRMEAKGGKGGKDWDDGGDYQAVTKIHARSDKKGIKDIKFDYVDKDGHPKEGIHGSTSGHGYKLEPFEINHLDKEYLLSIDGYYDETSNVIQALQFKTNMKTSELMGDYEEGEATKFTLGCNGNQIIGFHGYAEKNLNSLGAYFTSLPITKLECKYSTGNLWDDGSFQGVRKVHVSYNGDYVRCVRFEYENYGKVESREHGSKLDVTVQEGEFVLDYPNEVITCVEGVTTQTVTKWLTFKTSKSRTSPTFGNVFGENLVEFVLESKGCGIVGFHGRSSQCGLHALGAYFIPMPSSHDA